MKSAAASGGPERAAAEGRRGGRDEGALGDDASAPTG